MVRGSAVAADEEDARGRQARARRVLQSLRRLYPDAACTLDHEGPFQLLVATILSAQCTDERVNRVTPGLFRSYPDPTSFARARLSSLEEAIRSTGFYRNKARSIQSASRSLVDEHGGEVPRELNELTALAGVGRKTANVIRSVSFGEQAVVVDTHVKRLSTRLGFTRQTDPDRIEEDLMEVLPSDAWSFASQSMILHGRAVCKARRPRCDACGLAPDCPSAGETA